MLRLGVPFSGFLKGVKRAYWCARNNMLTKGIHVKLLGIVIGVISVGVIITVFLGYQRHERQLLDEKLHASKLMAGPILNTIYEDMLEERADLVRHLIKGLDKVEGIERVQIVRSNGVEEAFQDLKTIEAVKEEFGEVHPEWLEDHEEKEVNVAEGIDTEGFKEALKSFRGDWQTEAIYYVEKGDNPIFTFLQPIEKKPKCNACHDAEGARGILMISSSLDDMYLSLKKDRSRWILAGLLAIIASGFFLSVVIKRSITGPIEKTVKVIKRIAEGGSDVTERVEVSSEDEVGYLSSAFNNMLDSLHKRDEANRQLFSTVIKSREEWVTTFDAIQNFISIHDKNNRIIKVNMALAKKFNTRPENLLGMTCNELFFGTDSEETRCPHLITAKTGEMAVESFDSNDIVLNGTYKFTTFPIVSEAGEVTATVHIINDITDEQLLRDQLMHSEKVSSIGKFVAGIAHELNNPLMGIMGFSQILLDSPGEKSLESPDVKDKLTKIYDESLRTAKIVQNLLTFARAKKIEKSSHNINALIKKTLDMRSHVLKSNNIEVILDLLEDLPDTMVDHFQMQQVFLNVINNAMDAMVEDHSKGRLEISTHVDGKNIVIVLTDDGPGIPLDNLKKIFDPFFTTKEVGKGTGLGLSIIHGIVIEHGGTIEIISPDRFGAVVTIKLPISADMSGPQVKKSAQNPLKNGFLSDKRILVVDDEQSIREALGQVLEAEGMDVTTANDGCAALEELKVKEFDIVITDIKMPEVSGIELHEIIKNDYGSLIDTTIVLTGDVLSEKVKEFLKASGCRYMLKPFNPRDLIELIYETVKAVDK